ncbi:MAG: lamin tail domain-containing protein [Candidatus Brocadiales bacterium]|nr:lamin tail domain-containing protein [Candidatus Brocadiales bacterium]
MNNLKNENGYVLVVIIGILTILSLMTITFATLSRIEIRATRNYADSVKCEKIAKAALEHAIYIIRHDKFGDDGEAYNSDNGDENYDEEGDASWPGFGTFNGTDYDNSGNGSNDSAWIYFPATTSSLDIRLPGDLRARYSVLITDDREARINVDVTGNEANGGVHTSNEGWSTFEIDLSNIINQASTGNGTATASTIIDTRLGTDDAPGTSTTNDDTGIVPDPQLDNIDNDGDWVTGNDTNGNGIPDSGETDVDEADEATDEPNEFNATFPYGDDVPFGLLSETEIMGTSSYTSRLEEIFNTRGVTESEQGSLNSWITTCSADTILCPSYQLNSGTSTTKLNINALVNNQGAYTATGTYDSDKKVEMIMDVLVAGGLTGSSGSSNYVERHQLSVNIKDFIDSNGTVTAYNDGSDTYYGVERTPYINEVEAHVAATATDAVGTPTGMGKFIELFNPYDTAIDLTNWTITGTTMPQVTLTGTIGSQTYYVVADNQNAYIRDSSADPKGFSYEGGTDADEYNANINSLSTSGEALTFRDDNTNIVQVTNYTGNANDIQTMQLNDPRPTPLEDYNGSSSIDPANPWQWRFNNPHTAGVQNGIFDPTDGDDGWTGVTWTPSFLVANRRFSNKGYIGFIHNGRQWSSFLVDSTIAYPNVLQYLTVTDPSMDNIDNDGDGSTDSADTGSQSGDFDGQEHRIPGLINVNTATTQALQSLPNVDSTIATAIQGSGSKPFTSIGDLVDDVTQITGSGTKWNKEKTFRSISNLITTRSNVFTVYVTAQITDEAMSNVFAEKRILAIVDRSVDPIRVRYFRWLVE